MTMENFKMNLPKWPQMIVSGKTVTVEQAKEIIFRTDRFFTNVSRYSGGNCREFGAFYRRISGIEDVLNSGRDPREVEKDLRRRINFIWFEYVTNDWASSSFVGGPHGWCHPDGTIFFRDNVGKWPTVDELVEEWNTLAEEFPFLDLNVTIMDGESCESNSSPLFNIRVFGGKANVGSPDLSVHASVQDELMKEREFVFPVPKFHSFKDGEVIEYSDEVGLPMEWYQEFAKKVREALI